MVLRPVTAGDAESLLEYRSDPSVVEYLTHPAMDVEEVRGLIARATVSWPSSKNERFNLLFAVVVDDIVIGDLHAWNEGETLQPASPDPADVWIGYVVNPRYQGAGYATEAVDALIVWLFGRGARSVFASCYLHNTASIALLERLGFAPDRHYRASEDESGKNLASCRLRRDRETRASRRVRV